MAVEQLTFPGSSYLAAGTYDPEAKILTVSFTSGGVAEHRNVPPDTVEYLKHFGGSYYRSAIYGRYGSVSF